MDIENRRNTPVSMIGADPLLDEEALRVVGLTDKKWTPAKDKGKTVRSKFCLPVTFRLK